jgi:pyrimidine-nucleoside phosphorylase
MRAVDIIQRKRDGLELAPAEIEFFIAGYTQGEIPDYQASALAMAVFFRGMTPDETLALTNAMLTSGAVLDLSDLPAPKVDKHSTGGVGDKTSMIVGPLAAVCGVVVPMISGRGLGHTGGTLDKLESIPGFHVQLSLVDFKRFLERAGLAFIGQTPQIAPADRKLYALRDVTATVESLPLITASIMSKKLAEGIDGLVLDVKAGDGAFMRRAEDAHALASAMLTIGKGLGKKVVALVTDMEQPLGRSVGNALEIAECIETLKGRGPKDLESLSVELAARMVWVAGITEKIEGARARVREALASGKGLRKLQEVIDLQGGDPRVCDDLQRLPRSRATTTITAPSDGRIVRIGCRSIGHAAMLLGAGRETVAGYVNPAVGLTLHKKVGELVIAHEPLVTVHSDDERRLSQVIELVSQSITIGQEAPPLVPLVREVLS